MTALHDKDMGAIRLAVIGGGRMGEAIVCGLIGGGTVDSSRIVVADPDPARRSAMAESFGVECVEDGVAAVSGADVILLAVKPQKLPAVLRSLAAHISDALVISIAAGVSCARIESLLTAGTAVVRVMPNAPALVGEGMALVSAGSEASERDVETVIGLFQAIGRVRLIDERHQDVATALSGSGPAYFAIVIDALARAGVAQGLSRDVAQDLAVQTMLGTARLLAETGVHPETLVDSVASPGGTTIAAVERLEARGVRTAFYEAVAAAVRRSRELGREGE